jgi:hypothetical protein
MSSALKNTGGALRRATGGSIPARRPTKGGRILAGPLSQVSPITVDAPMPRGNPPAPGRSLPPPKRDHMVRPTNPDKYEFTSPGSLGSIDETISQTGEGLRNTLSRMTSRKGGRRLAARGGKIVRKAEGGKVGKAMTALHALAKKYQEALELGDTVLARRLKKQLDAAGAKDPEEEVGNEKAATFSKGGKVKKLARSVRARMDDLEGYIREGFGATREEAHANLRKQVAEDNGEDVADAVLKEHGVTYKRDKKYAKGGKVKMSKDTFDVLYKEALRLKDTNWARSLKDRFEGRSETPSKSIRQEDPDRFQRHKGFD